jgi:hypothetical protein
MSVRPPRAAVWILSRVLPLTPATLRSAISRRTSRRTSFRQWALFALVYGSGFKPFHWYGLIHLRGTSLRCLALPLTGATRCNMTFAMRCGRFGGRLRTA